MELISFAIVKNRPAKDDVAAEDATLLEVVQRSKESGAEIEALKRFKRREEREEFL